MTETLVIEAVSDKFKNKYSAGSVLAGGQWLQVSSKLKLADFRKDTQVEVETAVNDKGYKSIVGLVGSTGVKETPKAAVKEKAPVTERANTSYEDNKNRRILVQGITQAVAQSPALACLPGTSVQDIADNATTLARLLIEFVEDETK